MKVKMACKDIMKIRVIKIPGPILNSVFNIIVKGSVKLFHHDNSPRNLNGKNMTNME